MSHRRRGQVGNSDYYDSSDDESTMEKGHDRRVYNGACAMGQFFLNPCLCLWVALNRACQRRYVVRLQRRLKTYHYALGLALAVVLLHVVPSSTRDHAHPLRPRSDYQVNSMPIRIQYLDLSNSDDGMGGWLHPTKFRKPKRPLDPPPDKVVDFGSLRFQRLRPNSFERRINHDDRRIYDRERERYLEVMDKTYLSPLFWNDEELDYTECRRPNWYSLHKPNCNNFHEIDLARPYDTDISSLDEKINVDSYNFNHGYYRDAWLVENVALKDSTVMKTIRQKHEFTSRTLRMIQRDAIVMEQLGSSKYIINMHGYCGTSLTVEPIAYEVEEYIVPNGYAKQEDLMDQEELKPQNDYSGVEKLEMALSMAESIAVIHGFEGGVIVHNDIQPCQWLATRLGQIILGDFNRAEIMEWDDNKGEYCKYNLGSAFGNYRSPEEFSAKDLDEQLDVFSLGNNFYAILTGLWPFYENEDDAVVQKYIIDGKTAFIDDRYRTYSYGDGKLVEIIEKMWTYDPKDRPSVFDIVQFLREHYEIAKFKEEQGNLHASNY